MLPFVAYDAQVLFSEKDNTYSAKIIPVDILNYGETGSARVRHKDGRVSYSRMTLF